MDLVATTNTSVVHTKDLMVLFKRLYLRHPRFGCHPETHQQENRAALLTALVIPNLHSINICVHDSPFEYLGHDNAH